MSDWTEFVGIHFISLSERLDVIVHAAFGSNYAVYLRAKDVDEWTVLLVETTFEATDLEHAKVEALRRARKYLQSAADAASSVLMDSLFKGHNV